MRPAPERIGVIDLWRGFALFGVAVVNFAPAAAKRSPLRDSTGASSA